MDKVKEQAAIVGQLLFSAETGRIYKQTLTRTWDILREVGLLLWLVLCLTLVGGEWFYRTAVGLGRNTRLWYTDLSRPAPATEPQSMGSTGQALLDAVQTSTSKLIGQARQQLGIPEPEPVPPASLETSAPPVVSSPAPPAPEPVAPPPSLTTEVSTDEAVFTDDDDLA